MVNLSIKNVPEPVVEELRRRAARNHRSLQGELMALICRAVEGATGGAGAGEAPPQGTRSIEQIAAEHRARYKEPFTQGPRAVDLVRSARDAR